MTAVELAKKEEKAENLKVFQADKNIYYVESHQGKIAYRVEDGAEMTCTCPDFAKNANKPGNMCKHTLAVLNTEPAQRTQSGYLDKNKAQLDSRFIKSIKGKEFVLYSGLLDLGHQKKMMRLEVSPIQYPTKDNGMEAICKATLESKTGAIFTDIGDACTRNVGEMIAAHILRMASTRAKARVLRDFTNIGMTCLEELSGIDDVVGGDDSYDKGKNRKPGPVKLVKTQATAREEGSAPDRPVGNVRQAQNHAPENESTPNLDQRPVQNPTPEKVPPNRPVRSTSSTNKPVRPADSPQTNEMPPPTPSAVQPVKPVAQPAQGTTGEVIEMRPKLSQAQLRAIFNLARRRAITEPELQNMAKDIHSCEVEMLSSQDAASFIRN